MKREIKFRAWDSANSRMISADRLFINNESDAGTVSFGTLVFNLSHNYELLQFIGLKDESRKNIFEGDIVECDRCKNHEIYVEVVKDIRNIPRNMFGSNLNSLKVIGNIFENPDLIK